MFKVNFLLSIGIFISNKCKKLFVDFFENILFYSVIYCFDKRRRKKHGNGQPIVETGAVGNNNIWHVESYIKRHLQNITNKIKKNHQINSLYTYIHRSLFLLYSKVLFSIYFFSIRFFFITSTELVIEKFLIILCIYVIKNIHINIIYNI